MDDKSLKIKYNIEVQTLSLKNKSVIMVRRNTFTLRENSISYLSIKYHTKPYIDRI